MRFRLGCSFESKILIEASRCHFVQANSSVRIVELFVEHVLFVV